MGQYGRGFKEVLRKGFCLGKRSTKSEIGKNIGKVALKNAPQFFEKGVGKIKNKNLKKILNSDIAKIVLD